MSRSKNSIHQGTADGDSAGRGFPPRKTQFTESGNPKGRPPGSKNRKTIVKKVAREKHMVTEDGKKVRRTTLELVLIRLRNMALEGKSAQAVAEFNKWLEKLEPSSPEQKVGLLVVPAEISAEEWNAHADKANLSKVRPE